MPDTVVRIFISHISEEQVEATRAKEYLEAVFPNRIQVFIASSWTSIAPGEDWFQKIEEAIQNADIMLVLASGDSVARPWLQFETGAGWFAKQTKVIPVCHKGMTPAALPDPIRRLQAVDINAETEAQQLAKLAAAVRSVADLPEPAPLDIENLAPAASTNVSQMIKTWVLRPAAHKGQEVVGMFRVGDVRVVDHGRAVSASLDPEDSVFVRLFVEPPTGQFVNAMASGEEATLFEKLDASNAVVRAKIKLVGTHKGEATSDRPSPVIVVASAEERRTG